METNELPETAREIAEIFLGTAPETQIEYLTYLIQSLLQSREEQLKAKDDVIFTLNLERGLIEHQGKTILRQAEQIDSLTSGNERLRDMLKEVYNENRSLLVVKIDSLLTETKP